MSDEHITLVAEGNVKKINQRFKELEDEILALREELTLLQGAVGNFSNMVQAQTNMIQQVWVSKNGTGAV